MANHVINLNDAMTRDINLSSLPPLTHVLEQALIELIRHVVP
jgi:hypothetical protein